MDREEPQRIEGRFATHMDIPFELYLEIYQIKNYFGIKGDMLHYLSEHAKRKKRKD